MTINDKRMNSGDIVLVEFFRERLIEATDGYVIDVLTEKVIEKCIYLGWIGPYYRLAPVDGKDVYLLLTTEATYGAVTELIQERAISGKEINQITQSRVKSMDEKRREIERNRLVL